MLRTIASSGVAPAPRSAETVQRARALRAEHARAAAYQAYRVEQARAAAHYAEAARWREEYRRSVARCRLLGKMIRAGSQRSAAAATTASSVTALVQPQPANDDPTSGEAA